MEKAKVYFTSFKATGHENLLQKLHRLMKTAGFETIDFTDKYAAIKSGSRLCQGAWRKAFFNRL